MGYVSSMTPGSWVTCLGDQAGSGTEMGMEEGIIWGKVTDFDFGLGECTRAVGHPRGGIQLALRDWAQKKGRYGGRSLEIWDPQHKGWQQRQGRREAAAGRLAHPHSPAAAPPGATGAGA